MENQAVSKKDIFIVVLVVIGFLFLAVTWSSKSEKNDSEVVVVQQENKTNDSESRIKSMDEVEQIVRKQRQLPENQKFVKNFHSELKKFQSKANPQYRSIESSELDYNSIGLVITYDDGVAATQAPRETEDLVRFIVQYAVKNGKRPSSDSFFAFVQANIKFKGETEDRVATIGHALYNSNTDSIYWESSN